MDLNYFKARYLLLFLVPALLFSCGGPGKPSRKGYSGSSLKIDLPEIRERKKIIALTDFNATNYFIYRGEPMGYQYDLLHAFAKELDLVLEIIVENDLEKAFELLQVGKCDLLALNLTITKERNEFLRFTFPHTSTRQVLVQRRPENWNLMHPERVEKSVIRNQLELAGKTIFIQKNSSFFARLHNLSDEIGDSINIIEANESIERLITQVAKGEIDYTVCDENMAKVNQTFYPIIDIQTAISFPQNLAWAVRKKGTDQLTDTINNWLSEFKKTTEYALIYNKYFRNPKTGKMHGTGLIYIENGMLSQYDSLIKRFSDSINWDWRLLASMIYQESRFYADTVSWVGAFGLMQLMPATAEYYGVGRKSPPEENIRAGVEYLKWLDKVFYDKVKFQEERIKFILGAYNVGLGHILDARALARKYKKDPEIWAGNVEEYILIKSDPKYYLDPVVKYGYCRGEEVYNYVREIFKRYEDYKNIIVLN